MAYDTTSIPAFNADAYRLGGVLSPSRVEHFVSGLF
jgi:hypothetical protein